MADETLATPGALGGDPAAPSEAASLDTPSPQAGFPPQTEPVPPAGGGQIGFDNILDISVDVQILLGRIAMPVSKLVNLSKGEVIELNRRIGEPLDILANGNLIARGEIVILNEEEATVGISLVEVVPGRSERNPA